MDLRQLRYFTVLAETLNFHRAAEQLHISQPPLTVAIRKLEQELDAALFHRDARGVRLTDAGAAALAPAKAALVQAARVTEAVRLTGRGLHGRLTVGFVGSATSELLPRIVSPFRLAYPQVELVLHEGNSVEIVRGIASRQLDVGLVRLPVMDSTQVAMDVVERDELIVALPHALNARKRKCIDLVDLADRPFIIYSPVSVLHATIRLACQRAGFAPNVAQEATQVHTILSLVQSGLGVALVPSRAARVIPEGVTLASLTHSIPIEMGIARSLDAGPLAENFVRAAIASSDIH